MVRRPCCESMGLKKGPWTKEEDQILISYIHQFGHSNWRALPKQAGLMRCGKSCRLRWTNYLRPDIKRGNFSSDEEQTIIKLHEIVGNRWSAIAARLPGRTDNEIKNYWHINLKKKVQQLQLASLSRPTKSQLSNIDINTAEMSYFSTVSYDLLGKKSNNNDVSILSQPQLRFSAKDDVLLFWYDMYLKAGESMVQVEN